MSAMPRFLSFPGPLFGKTHEICNFSCWAICGFILLVKAFKLETLNRLTATKSVKVRAAVDSLT